MWLPCGSLGSCPQPQSVTGGQSFVPRSSWHSWAPAAAGLKRIWITRLAPGATSKCPLVVTRKAGASAQGWAGRSSGRVTVPVLVTVSTRRRCSPSSTAPKFRVS